MSPFEPGDPGFEAWPFGRIPRPSDIERVVANDLFAGIEPALAARSAKLFRVTTLPSRALVFARWHAPSAVILLHAGRIRLERRGICGETLALASIESGGFCGEDALFPLAARIHHADARCVEPSTVSFARGIDLVPLLEARSTFALNVARALNGRVAVLVCGITKTAPHSAERGGFRV